VEWREAKSAPSYRDKILNELARIEAKEELRRRLEKISLKEVVEIEQLHKLRDHMGTPEDKEINELIRREASLDAFFQKVLEFIARNLTEPESLEMKNQILAAIDRARAIEIQLIKTEERELSDDRREIEKDRPRGDFPSTFGHI